MPIGLKQQDNCSNKPKLLSSVQGVQMGVTN